MLTLLASLILSAAGAAAPAPQPQLSDAEVVRYLKPVELAEWGSAKRGYDAGLARVQQGESILKLPRAALAPGQIGETPEQVKARAEKVIADGRTQMAKAQPSLNRLRQVAATRHFDLTKPVTQTVDLPQNLWNFAITHSAIRLQKMVREAGYKEVHLLGASLATPDGKIIRTKAIGESVREAWTKVDPGSLASVPAEGYGYVAPPAGESTPRFSKGIPAPTEPRQVAMVWAELHQLDAGTALLFVRLADAHTFRIIASEAYLTSVGPADGLAKAHSSAVTLTDQRSFLPRLASSGDWVLSFERTDPPLAVALMRHLCVVGGQVGVGASAHVAEITGGDAPVSDGARASFRLEPSEAHELNRSYRVTSSAAGSAPVEVGTLTFKVGPKVDSAGKK